MICGRGSEHTNLAEAEIRDLVRGYLDQLGPRRKVLIVPPDHTRLHSRAGLITSAIRDYYGDAVAGILPALGTHRPMSADELDLMFPGIPKRLFLKHDCRRAVTLLGEIPGGEVSELSEGLLSDPWKVQVNSRLLEGGYDLVISVGQVVPHEVAGLANHAKNICVGVGGLESIDGSHFLGAVYGMERIMGRKDTPVRALFNRAVERFMGSVPLVYVLSVVSMDGKAVRGIYAGDGSECFDRAAELSQAVNVIRVDRKVLKAVVYCDPSEYRSFWLCNKSIYRTRMMIADGGELVVLAPGVGSYGENPDVDRLIGKHGYRGRERILETVRKDKELAGNRSIAAHLIHGSSEGRFAVTYCTGGLNSGQVERVGYGYGDLQAMLLRYPANKMRPGFNQMAGEEVYFIDNPGLGLWMAG